MKLLVVVGNTFIGEVFHIKLMHTYNLAKDKFILCTLRYIMFVVGSYMVSYKNLYGLFSLFPKGKQLFKVYSLYTFIATFLYFFLLERALFLMVHEMRNLSTWIFFSFYIHCIIFLLVLVYASIELGQLWFTIFPTKNIAIEVNISTHASLHCSLWKVFYYPFYRKPKGHLAKVNLFRKGLSHL